MATEGQRRSDLLRHRDAIESARLSTSQDKDRLVLYIAGGSLVVSVAFLERLGPAVGGLQAALLWLGWLIEIAAIVLVLRSLDSSQRALWSERERVDCMLSTSDEDPGWQNAAIVGTERLNAWASGLAVLGIVVLLAHAGLGLRSLSNNDNQDDARRATRAEVQR